MKLQCLIDIGMVIQPEWTIFLWWKIGRFIFLILCLNAPGTSNSSLTAISHHSQIYNWLMVADHCCLRPGADPEKKVGGGGGGGGVLATEWSF